MILDLILLAKFTVKLKGSLRQGPPSGLHVLIFAKYWMTEYTKLPAKFKVRVPYFGFLVTFHEQSATQ